MQQEKTDKQTRELVNEFRSSPLAFVREMWGLTPQPLKPEYADVTQNAPLTAFKAKWFDPFVKGKHITWQQWLIFRAVEDAIQGRAQRHISVKTGHGIGKTAAFAMLIIWFLFCWEDAQAPITAPTSDQLHDVLWKELKIWLDKMPKKISELYDHTTGYLRIKEREKTWFARARTARKENPEAFAGVHGEHVFVGADEASGVPEEVYKTAEGILTNENVLVLLISNPTRLVGYFHNTFKGDKHNWQVLEFSSEDSPIVEDDYCERMSQKYGKDSDEYRVRVLGRFPKEDAVDEKGYVPLLTREMLRFIPDQPFDKSNMRLGLDVAGEGSDKTVWVLRDGFKAKIILTEKKSTNLSIATRTNGLYELYKIPPISTWIDNFGEGANVSLELMRLGKPTNAVNVGDKAEDNDKYINRRAEAYWRMREWFMKGGMLIGDHSDWEDLLSIRYKPVEITGRLKIMGKEEMRKEGYPSPDIADALMLTFYEPDAGQYKVTYADQNVDALDQYSVF